MKNSKQEVWRDVPGYEGYFQASNTGNVRSLDRTVFYSDGRKRFYKGKILNYNLNKGGYRQTSLCKDGDQKNFMISQLVAMGFLDHTPDGHNTIVDHKNGDKTDDRVENLRLVTQRENTTICYRKDKDSFSSNFVGVYFNKQAQKWQTNIEYNSLKIYLGLYESEIKASEAYQDALKKINDNTFNPDKYKPKFYSKYKGVYFDKSRQKWFAKYTHNGKQKYLGSFKTEQEAYQKSLEFEACTLAV